jgi:hypothetical protein
VELDAQANKREISITVAGAVPVVGAFTEEVNITKAVEMDFKSSACMIFTELFTVNAETTTYENVRSDAEGLDRSAEDDVAIKDVQGSAGSNCVVAKTSTKIFSEEVFTENATAESVLVITVFIARKESGNVHSNAESRSECIAGRSRRSIDDFATFARIGNGASERAGSQGDCHDE